MTRTQCQAVALAEGIVGGEVDPAGLSDSDWYLLLLAADLNNPQSLPTLVCRRVLDHAARRVGFFDPRAPSRSLPSTAHPAAPRAAPATANHVPAAADRHAAPHLVRVDAPGRRHP